MMENVFQNTTEFLHSLMMMKDNEWMSSTAMSYGLELQHTNLLSSLSLCVRIAARFLWRSENKMPFRKSGKMSENILLLIAF